MNADRPDRVERFSPFFSSFFLFLLFFPPNKLPWNNSDAQAAIQFTRLVLNIFTLSAAMFP